MSDEWSEWVKIYSQLNDTNRRAMARMMRRKMRRRVWQAFLAGLTPRLQPTPAPMRLPLFHALVSFTLLCFLPSSPLAIPTALGLAFALVFYIQLIAHRAGYRLDF